MFSKTEMFVIQRQAFTMSTASLLHFEENVILNHFPNVRCIGAGVSYILQAQRCGKWQATVARMNVTAILLCWQMACQFNYVWQMLCPGGEEEMPLWQMNGHSVNCCSKGMVYEIATVTNVLATSVEQFGWYYTRCDIEWPLLYGLFTLFEFWGFKQNLFPYMCQIVHANVLVEEWIIDPLVYWFFYSSNEVLSLLPHHAEIVYCCGISRGVTMAIYWGRDFELSFKPPL